MTLQEFYEKYWTVDGKPVQPLTDLQKEAFAGFKGIVAAQEEMGYQWSRPTQEEALKALDEEIKKWNH